MGTDSLVYKIEIDNFHRDIVKNVETRSDISG